MLEVEYTLITMKACVPQNVHLSADNPAVCSLQLRVWPMEDDVDQAWLRPQAARLGQTPTAHRLQIQSQLVSCRVISYYI